MVLSEKQRHAIYGHLAPQWGEDVTQAFLSHFPAREGDEPVTRDYLRAEMAELRGELRAEIKGMGSKLAGLVIGVGAIVITAMGVATTVIVTQLN